MSCKRTGVVRAHKVLRMDVTKLREKLVDFDQEHLLDFWDDLTEEEQRQLYEELDTLDLEEVMGFFERTVYTLNETAEKLDDRMEPLPADQCGSVTLVSAEERTVYESLALEQVAAGNMAILLLAGGQGTRLGVPYPKGMYDVGLPSRKTLFQLQAERILRLQQLAAERTGKKGGSVAWYIMTSASTVKPTTDFFEKHDYFGLDPSNVVVFQQGTLPCFTFSGKIILASKYELARAPDGNGGLYRALKNDGILDDMERRGVQYVQLYCVDNILVKVGDPLFTGYCISKGAECANKVVAKAYPSESVGITCKVDGKYQVVEYSEITEKAAEMRNPSDNSLVYWAANVCIHFFTREFLRRVVDQHESELVHHVAKKKIPYIATDGQLVKPERPNGVKMEKFVFDVFRFADSFVVWECIREEEFAPLKNAEGAANSTPTYCREALYALHQKMILQAGGVLTDADGKKIPQMISPAAPKEANNNNNNNNNEKDVVVCEVSPLVSYAGEGLDRVVSGKSFSMPCCLTTEV